MVCRCFGRAFPHRSHASLVLVHGYVCVAALRPAVGRPLATCLPGWWGDRRVFVPCRPLLATPARLGSWLLTLSGLCRRASARLVGLLLAIDLLQTRWSSSASSLPAPLTRFPTRGAVAPLVVPRNSPSPFSWSSPAWQVRAIKGELSTRMCVGGVTRRCSGQIVRALLASTSYGLFCSRSLLLHLECGVSALFFSTFPHCSPPPPPRHCGRRTKRVVPGHGRRAAAARPARGDGGGDGVGIDEQPRVDVPFDGHGRCVRLVRGVGGWWWGAWGRGGRGRGAPRARRARRDGRADGRRRLVDSGH